MIVKKFIPRRVVKDPSLSHVFPLRDIAPWVYLQQPRENVRASGIAFLIIVAFGVRPFALQGNIPQTERLDKKSRNYEPTKIDAQNFPALL